MRECYVSFTSATDVHEFVRIATRQIFSIQVESGSQSACATSIMSLFCMGLHRPLRVRVLDAEADAASFFDALRPYAVA